MKRVKVIKGDVLRVEEKANEFLEKNGVKDFDVTMVVSKGGFIVMCIKYEVNNDKIVKND